MNLMNHDLRWSILSSVKYTAYVQNPDTLFFQIRTLCKFQGRYSYHKISKPRDSSLDFAIALTFDGNLGSSAAKMPAQLQSDTTIITHNVAASRPQEIWQ